MTHRNTVNMEHIRDPSVNYEKPLHEPESLEAILVPYVTGDIDNIMNVSMT